MCAKGSRSWRISAECDNQRSYTRNYPTSNIVDIRLSGRQHVPGYALALSLMFRHVAVVAAKRWVDELAIIFLLRIPQLSYRHSPSVVFDSALLSCKQRDLVLSEWWIFRPANYDQQSTVSGIWYIWRKSSFFYWESLAFVKELGHRVRQCSGEVKATAYLLQRLSVAVQRGNAVSVLGTVRGQSGLDLFCV